MSGGGGCGQEWADAGQLALSLDLEGIGVCTIASALCARRADEGVGQVPPSLSSTCSTTYQSPLPSRADFIIGIMSENQKDNNRICLLIGCSAISERQPESSDC